MDKLIKLPSWTPPEDIDAARLAIVNLGTSLHEHAYLLGKCLIWVKAKIGHGEFGLWLEENVWFSDRTSRRMIEFVGLCESKGQLQAYEPRKTDTVSDSSSTDDTKPHVTHNTGENEWYTPAPFIEAARKVLENIDLDPASSELANKTVQATRYFTKEMNGLELPWSGTIWLNPPYAGDLIGLFAAKMRNEWRAHNISAAIVLVNNATETGWFADFIACASAIVFPQSRIKFIDIEGNATGAPLQGQAFIYIGSSPDLFIREFIPFGWSANI